MGKLKRLATWVREHPRPALALVIGALMLIAVAALWQIFGWEEMRALVIVGDILTELGIALIIYGCLALTFDGLSEHQAREAAKRTTESVLAQIDVMSVRTTATVQQQISELSRRTTETMQGQIEDVSGRTAVAIQGQIEGMNQRIYGDRVYPVFKRFRDLTFSRTALKFSMDIDVTFRLFGPVAAGWYASLQPPVTGQIRAGRGCLD